jgi:hypothetical protein
MEQFGQRFEAGCKLKLSQSPFYRDFPETGDAHMEFALGFGEEAPNVAANFSARVSITFKRT